MKPTFGIFTTDRELVVRTWDNWLEEATSRAAAEVCGRPLADAFPEIAERGLLPSFHRALETGAVELLSPALHGYVIACAAKVGGGRFSRMQQRTVIAPLRDGPAISGLVVTVEDVTARRESEAENALLGGKDWETRREAVARVLAEPSSTPAAELIRRLRQEHRDPSVLNSVLHLLSSGAWETVDPLIELTADPDAELRMYAALALGNLRDRRAVPALIALLQDSSPNVKSHAIEALGRLRAAEAVGALASIAESGEFFLAFSALDALGAIGEPTVAPRLVPLLKNDALRPVVIATLSRLGDDRVAPPLASLLENPNLAAAVAQALAALYQRYEHELREGDYIVDRVARHITPRGLQNMVRLLDTASGDSLRVIVRVLGWTGSGNDGIIEALTRLLGSPSVRSEVIETLVRHGSRVTEALRGQLNAEDVEIRRAAIAALARIGSPDSVPRLVELLKHPELAIESAGALARIGDPRAYEPLLELLAHDRAAVRQAAVAALNSLGHPRMPGDMRRLLAHANPNIRESAVRVAGYFGYPDCASMLMDCVADPDEHVRRAAVEVLPNIEDPRVVDLLKSAAQDASSKIRAAAVQAFGRLETAVCFPDLMNALGDSDAWVRYYAARSLGQIGSPESIEMLSRTLREDSAAHVRIAAAEALGAIGGSRAVSILAPYADAEDQDMARAAVMAMGNVGHPDALGPLLNVLRSPKPSRRLDAVRALAARRDKAAVDALEWAAGSDRSAAVAEAAVEQLGRIAAPASIAALLRLAADRRFREQAITALSGLGLQHLDYIKAGLASPQLETCRAVVEALGRMRRPEASEALRAALNDDRPEIRLAAIIALKRIGSLELERKIWHLAQNDPDPGVREAAQDALQR